MSAIISLLLIIAGVYSSLLHADDGEAEIAAGGIEFRKSQVISMETEDLFVSEKIVRVKFGFKNNGTAPYKTVVAFPMPSYIPYTEEQCDAGMGTPCAAAGRIERAGQSFTVRSDGTRIEPKNEVRAFVGENEVTSLLTKYSISLDRADKALETIQGLPAAAQRELLASGALTAPQNKYAAERIAPNWTVKRIYFWEQTFPAAKTTTLEHEYSPIAGITQSPDSEELRSTYCIDDSTQKAMARMKATHAKAHPGQASLFGTQIHYILTSANTWVGPIRDFVLTVEKPTEASIASLCMDKIRKTGPKTFQAHLKDFTPSKELRVLFVR